MTMCIDSMRHTYRCTNWRHLFFFKVYKHARYCRLYILSIYHWVNTECYHCIGHVRTKQQECALSSPFWSEVACFSRKARKTGDLMAQVMLGHSGFCQFKKKEPAYWVKHGEHAFANHIIRAYPGIIIDIKHWCRPCRHKRIELLIRMWMNLRC